MGQGRFTTLSRLKTGIFCLCLFPAGRSLAPYLSHSDQEPLVWFIFFLFWEPCILWAVRTRLDIYPSYLSL